MAFRGTFIERKRNNAISMGNNSGKPNNSIKRRRIIGRQTFQGPSIIRYVNLGAGAGTVAGLGHAFFFRIKASESRAAARQPWFGALESGGNIKVLVERFGGKDLYEIQARSEALKTEIYREYALRGHSTFGNDFKVGFETEASGKMTISLEMKNRPNDPLLDQRLQQIIEKNADYFSDRYVRILGRVSDYQKKHNLKTVGETVNFLQKQEAEKQEATTIEPKPMQPSKGDYYNEGALGASTGMTFALLSAVVGKKIAKAVNRRILRRRAKTEQPKKETTFKKPALLELEKGSAPIKFNSEEAQRTNNVVLPHVAEQQYVVTVRRIGMGAGLSRSEAKRLSRRCRTRGIRSDEMKRINTEILEIKRERNTALQKAVDKLPAAVKGEARKFKVETTASASRQIENLDPGTRQIVERKIEELVGPKRDKRLRHLRNKYEIKPTAQLRIIYSRTRDGRKIIEWVSKDHKQTERWLLSQTIARRKKNKNH